LDERPSIALSAPAKPVCGAKRRDGGTCNALPMKNGRCYRHGGKSTGPKNGHALMVAGVD
jgi:hypothetical protein